MLLVKPGSVQMQPSYPTPCCRTGSMLIYVMALDRICLCSGRLIISCTAPAGLEGAVGYLWVQVLEDGVY